MLDWIFKANWDTESPPKKARAAWENVTVTLNLIWSRVRLIRFSNVSSNGCTIIMREVGGGGGDTFAATAPPPMMFTVARWLNQKI